jgi:hypothetical protein
MPEPYWNSNKEKLLCFMLLDDSVVQDIIVPGAKPAYWRAFIVQNRETGIISCKYRFKQQDSTNWYQIIPAEQNVNTAQDLREKMETVFRLACCVFGAYPDKVIQCFFPPDDGGDGAKTIIWLEMQDLVELTKVEGLAP